jgi:hypothetical protein
MPRLCVRDLTPLLIKVNCIAWPSSLAWLVLAVTLTSASGAALADGTAAVGDDARFSLRRLSQDQYKVSIADIFGGDIRISSRLEPDPRRDGLIAVGVANASVSAAGFEQYDAAAREIAAQVTDPGRRDTLIGCKPQDLSKPDPNCASAFVQRVGRLLYRRPLNQQESERFVALADEAATFKNDFYGGLSTALATMLQSVPFLFRVEQATPDGTAYRLDDYSVASRLSFLLWNAPPDDTLLGAVERGELGSADGIARQVDRMLASPRLESGVRAFFADMLALDMLDGLQKDPAIYPRFSNKLAADAREQTLLTIVDSLVRRNEDYRSLYTTRRTFLSRSLGLLYSEPVTSPTGWEPHEFAVDDPRAGLLSQPAFLLAHSHPGRSSPTLRGKAIRELVLCQHVPAPPPNVDFAIVQNVEDPRYATARQRLDVHNSEPMCAACHQIMDPLGLPFETFDGSAGMRATENGVALDLSGQYNGKAFNGGAGLSQLLAADPALSTCLVNRLYAYGAGSTPEGQSSWLDLISSRYEGKELRIRDVLRAIALSDDFYRVQSEPGVVQVSDTDSHKETPDAS